MFQRKLLSCCSCKGRVALCWGKQTLHKNVDTKPHIAIPFGYASRTCEGDSAPAYLTVSRHVMKKVFCRSKFLSSPFNIRWNIVLGITRLLCLAEVAQRFLASSTPGHGSAYSPIEYRPKICFRACVTLAEIIRCSLYRNMWLNISMTRDRFPAKNVL
jgi:hypothetical protein